MYVSVERDQTRLRRARLSFPSATYLLGEGGAKSSELAKSNSLPDSIHGVKVEGQVVVAAEGTCKYLIALAKVTNVSSRITPADRTGAVFIQWPIVPMKPGVSHIHPADGRKNLSIARIARWKHAIEHISAARNAFDKVLGRPDSH